MYHTSLQNLRFTMKYVKKRDTSPLPLIFPVHIIIPSVTSFLCASATCKLLYIWAGFHVSNKWASI